MSDFHQHGLISTLQRLSDSNAEIIESELAVLAQEKPISLVLPCHFGDLGVPLERILDKLSGASFLSEIIVSVNGGDEDGFRAAKKILTACTLPVRVLWNDSPAFEAVHALLSDVTQSPPVRGKGLNVWAAIGLVVAEGKSELIVTQDCDVASFRRETFSRLCYAGLRPGLGFDFSKMYYSRVTDRIYGRVSRLFLAPLLQALVRVVGHHPLLDFLLSFRYPLAGECALRRELAAAVSLRADWGLEIGMLCEVFRAIEPARVCQVDGGGNYDHRHHPLETESGGGLGNMSAQIARALFDHIGGEGVRMDEGFAAAVQLSWRREAQEALRRYESLALMNSIPFDSAGEQQAVDVFSGALERASSQHAAPKAILPSWKRIASQAPDFVARFREAVAAENA